MIGGAEKSGPLRPGGTIVEPTSGNTGVGLALVAQTKGYHCVFVCPDKVSEDKQRRAPGVRRRGGGLPDRGAAGGSRVRTTRSLTGWLGRSRAPGSRTSTRTRTTRARTTRRPGPELWEQTERPDHPLRGRRRHRRHHLGHRPLPQGGLRRPGAGHRRRPGGLGLLRRDAAGRTLSRASARTSGRRRTTGGLRRDRRGLRQGVVRADPAAGPGGGPAGRRLVRDGRGGRPRGGPARPARRRDRGAAARRRPGLPLEDLQ